ncbi:MAG: SDR family oxidoreductase [Candidatus Binatus sp.]|uniref:SDR family oxidoreductase n=1 Tax=Candidatus Binatus sp. TaxID=2811406 RepID=UPI002728C54A|nr:SDR family oxidoreductase [Candidatus Binatus sp.]MDO8431161.1 SDR family oxidoreductase [Candidatus Binatus sp.]
MPKRKILIAGASGLVGFAAVRHFAALDDWEVTAVSRRLPRKIDRANLVSVDLFDRDRCADVFSQMSDVTHVVYAAVSEQPGLLGGWRDPKQMQANLTMLQNFFDPLEAVAKNLEHVTLLQGTKAYGAHLGPIPIPARERAPRHQHANFYWLQEDYLRSKQAGKRWHWTILRPQAVIGEAIGGNLNLIPPIGVYAAIRREAGLPLSFPGGAPSVFEMVDVDLLANMMEWAATTPACRNETFNSTNGDVASWEDLWPAVADALGMEVGAPEPMLLAEEMPRHQDEWAAIVKKYNLDAPADLHAYVGESFYFADAYFAYGTKVGSGLVSRPMLVSTIKARQAGFHDCMDSKDMMYKWFRRFQELRLLPPTR